MKWWGWIEVRQQKIDWLETEEGEKEGRKTFAWGGDQRGRRRCVSMHETERKAGAGGVKTRKVRARLNGGGCEMKEARQLAASGAAFEGRSGELEGQRPLPCRPPSSVNGWVVRSAHENGMAPTC